MYIKKEDKEMFVAMKNRQIRNSYIYIFLNCLLSLCMLQGQMKVLYSTVIVKFA